MTNRLPHGTMYEVQFSQELADILGQDIEAYGEYFGTRSLDLTFERGYPGCSGHAVWKVCRKVSGEIITIEAIACPATKTIQIGLHQPESEPLNPELLN